MKKKCYNSIPFVCIFYFFTQIKLYTAKKSVIPEIDDFYIATAHNDESWLSVVKAHNDQLTIIVYCAPTLVVTTFILIVAVFFYHITLQQL